MGHVILTKIFISPYWFATVQKYPSKQLLFAAFLNLSFSYLFCRFGPCNLSRERKPRLPLPLPTKTLIKFQETGGTVTHTLQVLHSLPIGTSLRRMSELLAQALTQAYHSYTHTLLGVVEEHVSGPIGPPVKGQENTALLSNCGLTGTPLRVSLSGLGGKECSVCVHSVYERV